MCSYTHLPHLFRSWSSRCEMFGAIFKFKKKTLEKSCIRTVEQNNNLHTTSLEADPQSRQPCIINTNSSSRELRRIRHRASASELPAPALELN